MQKTRFGITVGLLGAAIYFMGLFGGYLVTALLAAYVLLFEENQWLKKNAVKSIAIMILFSLLSVLVHLIPNAISFIDDVIGIFGGSFYIGFISKLANAVTSALNLIETVLFIALGIKALNQGNIAVPVVDKLIDKYMG